MTVERTPSDDVSTKAFTRSFSEISARVHVLGERYGALHGNGVARKTPEAQLELHSQTKLASEHCVIDESKDEYEDEQRVLVAQTPPSPRGDLSDEEISDDGTLQSIPAVRDQLKNIRKKFGLMGLAARALGDKSVNYHHFVDRAHMHSLGTIILAYTHSDVITAILEGDMARRYLVNPNFRSLMQQFRIHQSGGNYPLIYVNQIADSTGRSPTPSELMSVIPKLRSYVDGSDLKYAKNVDAVYNTKDCKWNHHAYRKYMFTHNGPSAGRIAKTNHFLKGLEARCKQSLQPDKPLPGWLPEVGYTHDGDSRLKNHRLHQSSNYMMNLVEAALALEFPQKFQLFQFIVHFCQSPITAGYSELIFTELASAYTGNGGGFVYHPPGRSNISARWFMTSDWENWFKWVVRVCKADENERNELALQQRIEAKRVEREQKDQNPANKTVEKLDLLSKALTTCLPDGPRLGTPTLDESRAEVAYWIARKEESEKLLEADKQRFIQRIEGAEIVLQILQQTQPSAESDVV